MTSLSKYLPRQEVTMDHHGLESSPILVVGSALTQYAFCIEEIMDWTCGRS
jgi:hypothetical protein